MKTARFRSRVYRVGKKLGAGMVGTTFGATRRGKRYALKIEHVLEKDRKDRRSPTWREIAFLRTVAQKHPDMFTRLYDVDFVDDCTLKQRVGPHDWASDELLLQHASPVCKRMVLERVDGTLDEIMASMTTDQVLGMVAQLSDILAVMHASGYTHNDLHAMNIGYSLCRADFVRGVPSFGRQFRLIDYGGVVCTQGRGCSGVSRDDRAMHAHSLGGGELIALLLVVAGRGSGGQWDKAAAAFAKRYPLLYAIAQKATMKNSVGTEVFLINVYPSLIIPLLHADRATRAQELGTKHSLLPPHILVALMPAFFSNQPRKVRDIAVSLIST